MATNVFDECCKLVRGNDHRHATERTPSEQNIAALASLVQKHDVLNKKILELGHLQDLQAVAPVMDPTEMKSTQLSLEQAVWSLQRVVKERVVLATRLKDLSSKQTIPVETDFQLQFQQLLTKAAEASVTIQHAQDDVCWALDTSQSPASWECMLQPLSEATKDVKRYHTLLQSRSQALTQYRLMMEKSLKS